MNLKWRKILLDPTFWVLPIINIWLLYCYEQDPKIFATLIWLYWSQSMLYGFFTYLYLKTAKRRYQSGFKYNEENKITEEASVGAETWFASRLFIAFHIIYVVFLAGFIEKTGPFDWDLYWKFLAVFLVFQLVSFIQHKIQNRDQPVDVARLAYLPFLRVIPIHLCIIIPAFLSISNLTVFLIIKTITDQILYVKTTNYYQKNDALGNATTLNIQSTISSQ